MKPPSAPSPAVSLANVTFRYPASPAAGIFDLSLNIAPGELVVCIGPSGCGKTTLLRLIAGFLTPNSGFIRLGGKDLTVAPARSRECGVVFQAYALFPHMRVWENVAYPLRVRDVPIPDRRRRAQKMLELVGLSELADRLPLHLSGGQQQRVALARALVFEPRAVLLDEPLSALDVATRVAMREEILRIQRRANIATLLITHDQDEALSMADRVAVLRDGRLIQYAPPQEIYDRPADAFVANFVGRANLLNGTAGGPDAVDTPIGRLVTPPHGRPAGTMLCLLLRPARIEPAQGSAGENIITVKVLRDRFFGATRQLTVAAGNGQLEMETAIRGDFSQIRVPRDAINFCLTAEEEK
jgi:putative spermidine/putrescine transport system ATP-binding protein